MFDSINPRPVRLALIAVLRLCFAAPLFLMADCASQPEHSAASTQLASLLGRPPAGTFYKDGRLLLHYNAGKEPAYLGAA